MNPQTDPQPNKPAPKTTFWHKLLSIKPLGAEKEIDLGHDYDGIRELNNPIPPWFNVLFYGTILFAGVYMIIHHITESAPLQAKEYQNQMAEAEQAKAEFRMKNGGGIDETNVVALTETEALNHGAEIFKSKCAVCHGEEGEGKVGPNLTDAYWLHGGGIKNIFKTIKYGVPAKGMIPWENSLKSQEMQEVSSYILSLNGSNPPNAKAPQGEIDNAQ